MLGSVKERNDEERVLVKPGSKEGFERHRPWRASRLRSEGRGGPCAQVGIS